MAGLSDPAGGGQEPAPQNPIDKIDVPVENPGPLIEDPIKDIDIPIEDIGTFTRIKIPPAKL